jgi:hypothetical protein
VLLGRLARDRLGLGLGVVISAHCGVTVFFYILQSGMYITGFLFFKVYRKWPVLKQARRQPHLVSVDSGLVTSVVTMVRPSFLAKANI